ncbi:MAG: hypothetical protein AB8F95_18095 [Bacteroidia bacterium]
MAIIVKHRKTGAKALLIGAGFGAHASARPDFIWGDWSPRKESGTVRTVAICGKNGVVRWVNSSEIIVVEIDGMAVSDFDITAKIG